MSDYRLILTRARKRLEQPSAWCRGAPKSADGRVVDWDSPDAVCWCLAVACGMEARVLYPRRYMAAKEALLRLAICIASVPPPMMESHNNIVVEWNDMSGRTHADVLALIDQAIAEGETNELP